MSFFDRLLFLSLLIPAGAGHAQSDLPNPVLFVTQVPQPADFTTVGSVFGNQQGSVDSAPRGGDLWIRYPDGGLKNLTAAAGYGMTGQQGNTSIAVRQPSVHWSGTKAVFSMVAGSPAHYQVLSYYWQMYEISGLGKSDTPVITKVPNQPASYNNISPVYGTDDRIIFTTDRPRDGQAHLYPQRDEYEEAPVVTGLWSLDPASGDLRLLQHAPSGSFTPIVDSFGRVLFTRWDHLQRDQQADSDVADVQGSKPPGYGTFNFPDEAAGSTPQYNVRAEVFPEPRGGSGTVNSFTFNQFFPWQINQDGTEEETLNHVGRHELYDYMNQSFNNDPNLREFYNAAVTHNPNRIFSFLHMREDPQNPGRYYGINAPEFGTHSGGQVVSMDGPPGMNPDNFLVTYHTPKSTASATPESGTPAADHTGLYRNPLPLADGQLLAVHTSETRADRVSSSGWQSRYAFRIKKLVKSGQYYTPGANLTNGISKSVTWWDPDTTRTYSGELWELDPVEVRVRPRPAPTKPALPSVEAGIFTEQSVHVPALKEYLKSKNLALVVSRNVTTRDHADTLQPYNLRVNTTSGTGVETIGTPGKIYDIRYMQFFQGDLIRGLGVVQSSDTPRSGRRVLAQVLHDANTTAIQPPNPAGPAGSVKIEADGSMAAFVPARRALSWHLTSPVNDPVVRERYWLTFQPGEIRTCTSCHGLNTKDQANHTVPTNPPEALRTLLQHWKTTTGLGAAPKEAWKQQKFGSNSNNTAVSGDLADPDGDGVNNLLEYAFGTDPVNGRDLSLPKPSLTIVDGSPRLTITFQRSLSATDLRYQVEYSIDQQNWTVGNSYAYDDEVTSTAETMETARSGSPVQTISVRRINAASGRQFMRVKITGL
jgi:hypothetical protein